MTHSLYNVCYRYKGWLAGYQMSLNSSKKALTANNFSLAYDNGDHVVHASV